MADGTTVTLTAAADPGSTFTNWSGPCTGSDTTCSFTVSGDATVGAAFDLKRYTVTVALAGGGTGTVTAMPGALSCPSMCSISVDAGTVITLIATPAAQPQSKFVGWGTPACSGTAPCVLPINGDQTITAIFAMIGCGNGVMDPGEECDDGNTSNNDACTNACTIAKCGDGFTWGGHEECDDGANNKDTNAATPAPAHARWPGAAMASYGAVTRGATTAIRAITTLVSTLACLPVAAMVSSGSVTRGATTAT